VFAFLADGSNDPKFSPRVQKMAKTTDGPTGEGTVYASTVKDAGMTTSREFRITAFEEPQKIRWAELSKNLVTAVEGGYDLEAVSDTTTRLREPHQGGDRGDLTVRGRCHEGPLHVTQRHEGVLHGIGPSSTRTGRRAD